MSRALVPALVAISLFLMPMMAWSESSVALRVDFIIATEGESPADPSLTHIADQLARQFPQFSAFQQVRTTSVTLRHGTAQQLEAAQNVTVTLTLRALSDEEATVVVGVPGGEATVRLPAEGLVFLAGPVALPEGTWIFAVARR